MGARTSRGMCGYRRLQRRVVTTTTCTAATVTKTSSRQFHFCDRSGIQSTSVSNVGKCMAKLTLSPRCSFVQIEQQGVEVGSNRYKNQLLLPLPHFATATTAREHTSASSTHRALQRVLDVFWRRLSRSTALSDYLSQDTAQFSEVLHHHHHFHLRQLFNVVSLVGSGGVLRIRA